VANAGKSFSMFGNKLLCDPYFLEFIENIHPQGSCNCVEGKKKRDLLNENMGMVGFAVEKLLKKIGQSDRVWY
jgi:hypothetical protein